MLCRIMPMPESSLTEKKEVNATEAEALPPPPRVLPHDGGPVMHPSSNDVLSGRGGRINAHPGNLKFREFVHHFKDAYGNEDTKKTEKAFICAQIVYLVRTQNPPGRFLKRDEKKGYWFEIGDVKARKKTGQALREDWKGVYQQFSQQDNASATSATSEPPSASEKVEITAPISSMAFRVNEVQRADSLSTSAGTPSNICGFRGIGATTSPGTNSQSIPNQKKVQRLGKDFHKDISLFKKQRMALYQENIRSRLSNPACRQNSLPSGVIPGNPSFAMQGPFTQQFNWNQMSNQQQFVSHFGEGNQSSMTKLPSTPPQIWTNTRTGLGSNLEGPQHDFQLAEDFQWLGHSLSVNDESDDATTTSSGDISFAVENVDSLSVGNLSSFSWGSVDKDKKKYIPPKEISFNSQDPPEQVKRDRATTLPLPLSKRTKASRLA